MLGAGANHRKKLQVDGTLPTWENLTTLDFNPDHKPDVLWDLECLPLPFDDNSFDEIHAYEVLEHTGRQGDWRFFFAQFTEFWRILKPDGYLLGTAPAPGSRLLWGDPGHTRALDPALFTYLSQREYSEQVGVSAMSDYRFCWDGDFEQVTVEVYLPEKQTMGFMLQAIKPSRKGVV